MTLGAFSRRYAASAGVVIVAVGWSGTVAAADPIPAPIVAGPAVVTAPEAFPTYPASGTVGCETCGRGHSSLFHNKKTSTPRAPYLAPGACFGYFQTQWHRWEEVCPIPYVGAGLTDAPARPAPPMIPAPAPTDKKGSDTPLPKKVPPATAPEPTTLPSIPQLPSKTSKF